MYVSKVKDSSFILPEHHLSRILTDGDKMMTLPKKICMEYFTISQSRLKKYNDWLASDWVASTPSLIHAGKKLMLIYNIKWMIDLDLKIEDVPADWLITTDRRYFQQADAVVFHLPNLSQELECNLSKPQEQIWVSWYLDPCVISSEIGEMFDLQMGYRQDVDVVYPYYRNDYPELFSQPVSIESKENKTYNFAFNHTNKNNQLEYINELNKNIEINSYTHLYSNLQLSTSQIHKSKLDISKKSKFVIEFEDAIEPDYVTDKFFDPLLAGSVPIYLGAPNIEDFAPGDNCFIDVRQFENPQSLARFINACYEDDRLYSKFFEWRNQPLRQSFLKKIEEQKEHPLVCLCRKVDEMNKKYRIFVKQIVTVKQE